MYLVKMVIPADGLSNRGCDLSVFACPIRPCRLACNRTENTALFEKDDAFYYIKILHRRFGVTLSIFGYR